MADALKMCRWITFAWSGGLRSMSADHWRAMDHVVHALFENRSFDNLLGGLYGPAMTWRAEQQNARIPRRGCGARAMELGGLEPPTSWVRSRRSPN